MSEENLPSVSLRSGTGDVPENKAGFGDVPEQESKSELEDGDTNADWVGDTPDEVLNEEDEGEAEEEVEKESVDSEEVVEKESVYSEEVVEKESVHSEEVVEKESLDNEEVVDKESLENGKDEVGKGEEQDSTSHEEEEEVGETVSSLSSSSTSVLIITYILEEILEAVFKKSEGEEHEEAEVKSKEEKGEEWEDEDKEWGEEEIEREHYDIHPTAARTSLATIKSAATITSELSEERRLLRQSEENQIRKEREAQSQQQKFEENVRLFHQFVRERGALKRKNAYLTRKMYEFYRLHKIEHLFKELPSGNQEMEARYIRALSRYDELKNSADIEEGKVNALIDLLTNRHEEVAALMQEELAALAAREREVGDGLLFTLTSKMLQDKALDKLIQQQLAKCAEVDEVRVKFFILRDAVSSEESQLKALDDIGEGCTMKEYEQLRLHNQGCTEKLEEKDSELEKIRTKALSAMQIFTEVREAAQATAEDIETEKRALTDVERDLAETRERLGSEKKRRDLNRFDTVRLQREAGLTSQPKLIRHYRKSKIELDKLKEDAVTLREKFARQNYALTTMRRSIKSELSSVK